MVSGFSRVAITILLIFPYLVFLAKITRWDLPPWSELGPVIKFTFLQSVYSAFFSVFGGLFIALGLARKYSRNLEILILIPVFVPSLFLVISLLNLIRPFPFGLVGTVLAHVFSFSGLVGVVLFAKMRERLGGMIELAFVEGANRRSILFKLVLPLLKSDIMNLFVLVFIIAFGSFSIPLITGSVGAVAFEVLTYQKIIIEGNFAQAFGLATMQVLLVAMIVLSYSPKTSLKSQRIANLSGIGLWPGLFYGLFISFGSVCGIFFVVPHIPHEIESVLPGRILGSLLVGMGVGVFSFLCLSMIVLGSPHVAFEKFLKSYVAPSVTLVGFAFLLLGITFRLFSIVAIVFGLVMVFIPGLYRLLLDDNIRSLRNQIEVARTMGATNYQIFSYITFPQCAKSIGLLSGCAGFWAVGDFALSRLVSDRTITVAMLVDDLLGSYRLSAASVLAGLLLVIGAGIFWMFRSLGNVLSQKSDSPL